MGPIQDAPRPLSVAPEEVGYCVFWYQISYALNSSRAHNDSPHQEGCAVESTNQKEEKKKQCRKHIVWLQTETDFFFFFLLQISFSFPTVTVSPERSGEIVRSGGNTMVWITLHHWALVQYSVSDCLCLFMCVSTVEPILHFPLLQSDL